MKFLWIHQDLYKKIKEHPMAQNFDFPEAIEYMYYGTKEDLEKNGLSKYPDEWLMFFNWSNS